MEHRYILQPYNGRGSRFACPQCRKNYRFTRYIDTQTNTYIAGHVGKCDRIDRCGYHYPPRDYFAGGGSPQIFSSATNYDLSPANYFDTLPLRCVEATVKSYERNNFVNFLSRCFDKATAFNLAYKYNIGTAKHWPGATIFWQMDAKYNVRTGKIMLYNPADGHRVKEPYNHIAWAHPLVGKREVEEVRKPGSPEVGKTENRSVNHLSDLRGLSDFRTKNFVLNQCFFGEHLLNSHPRKKVAICESEKTAVMGSLYRAEHIWLAAGSLEGLSVGKCKVLKGRRVVLFPDVNGYNKWKLKARELNLKLPATTFTVDKTLENTATPQERAQGIDLADRWIGPLKLL